MLLLLSLRISEDNDCFCSAERALLGNLVLLASSEKADNVSTRGLFLLCALLIVLALVDSTKRFDGVGTVGTAVRNLMVTSTSRIKEEGI